MNYEESPLIRYREALLREADGRTLKDVAG